MGTKTTTAQCTDRASIQDIQHRGTATISPVYHVGDLDGDRSKPHTSHEGRGVSVSIHPKVWEQIIRSDGTSTHETLKTYKLTNPAAEFYYINPVEPLDIEIEWCIENGFVARNAGYKVTYEDEISGSAYMEFVSETEATAEAKARGGEITETEVLTLAQSGVDYWAEAFQQPPEEADPILISGLTPVWYAKAHGYDGVWWDEKLDPDNYSAPRGVIFQSKLNGWESTVERTTSPAHV